ncbi:MAG: Gfo/Idh/MocA family oxidoreductase, partial [Saprospiraceae bacterium]|nr:Gfo/Idh/MocA family oxidoreductase [Saprospiraceae bacterium]
MKRRTFLEKASLASAMVSTTKYIPGLFQDQKIKVGLIGCGWYGMVISEAALEVGGVEIIAVCDVDSKHLQDSIDRLEQIQGTRPRAFTDYRELIDMQGMEAIFIGTPPHWHALQFIAACEKGLDIYCEKPLSYDVKEGLAMVKAAKKAGNYVQIGFQRRKTEAYHRVQEMIAEGRIGKIHEVGAQIHYNPGLKDHLPQTPPSTLDWDSWCGPAPMLPYSPNIGHKSWRLEKEYGNGHLVDWGIHHIDTIRMILALDMPERFEVHGDMRKLKGKITTPDTLRASMFFDMCPVIWQHRLWGTGGFDKKFNNGIFFYGEEGTIFTSDRQLMVMPNAKDAEVEEHEVSAKTIRQDMMADFIRAVQQQDKA